MNQNGPANVKFVPVLRAESTKKFNVLFASGSAPDIINEYDTNFRNSLYDQKQLLPIDDLLKDMPEYQKLLNENPQLKKAGTKPDGKLYEIGKMNEAYPLQSIFIRTDWLKKLNLEAPKTTEDMLKVAKAFTDLDPDGNGKKDTYGMNLSWNSELVVKGIFGDMDWAVKDGKVIRSWDNKAASLEFRKSLFDAGVVDRDYINDKTGAKAKQDFLNGKVGMYVHPNVNWFDFLVNDLATLKKNAPEAEVTPMAFPKSSMGEFTAAVQNPVQMTTVINAKTKDPVAAAKFIDFMMIPENASKLVYGDEGTHYTKGPNGCPQVSDAAKLKSEVSYAGDYAMFMTRITNKCNYVQNQFNQDLPDQKAALDLFKVAQTVYLDPSKQYPGIAVGEHMPPFSNDLNVIKTNVDKEILDLEVRTIVGGDKYSTEQGMKDMKSAWDKAGGKQLEDFMNSWYTDNKEKAFLAKDVWDIVNKQKDEVNK